MCLSIYMALWNLKMHNESSLWHLTVVVAGRKNIFSYTDLIIYPLTTEIFIILNDILKNALNDSP